MNFNEFLQDQTKRLAKPVHDFMGTLAVYEGEADENMNEQCRKAYYSALDAARIWIRLVELIDLVETEYMESITVLHLPEDDIKVAVTTRALVASDNGLEHLKDFNSEIPGFNSGHKGLIGTPIGEINSTTLNYILGVEDNPVMLLYKHLGDLVHCIHNILSMPLHDSISYDVVLTAELLKEHNIQDVLGVYKMDRLLYDIHDFFKSYITK